MKISTTKYKSIEILPFLGIFLLTVLLGACRDENIVVYPTAHETGDQTDSEYAGMYVLNEGNMGSNKCTLDYLDLSTGTYTRNIYPSRNPNQVMELGDVGNDIKIYGSSLWMVVNMSNKVEVAHAATAVSRGHVDIPNCRNIAFANGYAYVSSYVGKVNGESVLGGVYKVDTTTLQVMGKVTVGYQPDELAVVGSKLYVANSGGYQAVQGHGYDRRVSVIDLAIFTHERDIDVAPNLSLLRADRYGQLWVASRGDYKGIPSRLYLLKHNAAGQMAKADSIDIPVGGMYIEGDSIYYYGASFDHSGQQVKSFGIINIRQKKVVDSQPLQEPTDNPIRTPYGIIVHPISHDIYVMDATNYVSSGKLYCFDRHGKWKWTTWTGDIPAHAVLVPRQLKATYEPPIVNPTAYSKYIQAVDEYLPAPGQFVNTLPECTADDTPATVAAKCTEAIGGNRSGLVTLGSYGGYVTFHFDHSIANMPGERDLYIKGNTYDGNSEPGIVMVSQDTNHNGSADDPWYELAGSADIDSATSIVYDYEITYVPNPMGPIGWTDNRGGSGTVDRNSYHTQEYYPLWHKEPLRFKGTLLPRNATNQGRGNTQYWVLNAFGYGYVDNVANTDTLRCSFDIAWAVDKNRHPVQLDYIDFVRVYCAENQQCGWIGETSTEVSGAEDLHLEASIAAMSQRKSFVPTPPSKQAQKGSPHFHKKKLR